jgi:glycine hydroxymethyltransferase
MNREKPEVEKQKGWESTPHRKDDVAALPLSTEGLSWLFQTDTRKISAVSVYFETMPYRLDEKTGYIDYDTLEANAKLFRPKILIAGSSASSRSIDYARMRKVGFQCSP